MSKPLINYDSKSDVLYIVARKGEEKEWKNKKENFSLTRNAPKNIRDINNLIDKRFDDLEENLKEFVQGETSDVKTKLSSKVEEFLDEE